MKSGALLGFGGQITNSDYAETQFGYDAYGDLTSTTDPNGVVRTSSYDPNGNQTGSQFVWTDPNPPNNQQTVTTTNHYNAADQLYETDSPTGTTTSHYDILGRVDGSTDNLGGVSSTTFDARGLTSDASARMGR